MIPLLIPVVLLAGAILLVGVSVRWTACSQDAGLNSWSRFFLVGLRLVIGWHFLVEGLEKLHAPTWSSEAYLREASGPLAPRFRALAGDRLIDKLTVGADGSFPKELENEWRTYVNAFGDFYQLNDEYKKTADRILDQAKSKTLTWLTTTKQSVQIATSMPPPYSDDLTIAERLTRHEKLEAAVRAIEADIPKLGAELFSKYKNAKSELSKWRADLKRDLDQQFQSLKRDLRDGVLLPRLMELVQDPYRSKLPPIEYRINRFAPAASTIGLVGSMRGHGLMLASAAVDAERFKEFASIIGSAKEKEWVSAVQGVHHEILLRQISHENLKLDPAAQIILVNAFERKQGEQSGDLLLPKAPTRPISTWTLLDWSDSIVKYGLVIVGACLLGGFLTRTACLAGAGFLLMFFLAMPPFPGWPENPRAEGHYLYINKNIIEMFALLALATTRSGRWAGLDGFLQFLRPARWRTAPAAGNLK